MHHHLFRRYGHFYFRLHIPVDLRYLFGGRSEFRETLKTTRYDGAKGLVKGYLSAAEKRSTRSRSGLMTDKKM
ncbi:MAG TPA: DUF6538 domain-containing protein, partial [Candidatus Aquicultoraceae bacterium]|nr:DUF6538 domain-containing protein [Candidatus Aquicultoraceae bacterium]